VSSSIPALEISVGDYPVDGAHIVHNGKHSLYLRPQFFESAVRHVRNVLPDITYEQAEQLVREQCPEMKPLDELLGANDPPVLPVDVPPQVSEAPPRRLRRRQVILAAALLPALAASWALGQYTDADVALPGETRASAPDTTAEAAAGEEPGPFTDSRFQRFTGAGSIDCTPISALEAECTDADGVVMLTKAATGPDSTIFTFSYGSERLGLRVFNDAAYAQTWARQDGTERLYPNLQMHGRYGLWGTDTKRIQEYGRLLAQQATPRGPLPARFHPAGGTSPLPPRLAALTLGALGLNESDVEQIIASPSASAAATPVVAAARMVLGLDSLQQSMPPGGEDIVALAAGIEPGPPVSGTPPAAKDVAAMPVTSPAAAPQPAPAPQPGPAPAEPVVSPAPAPAPTASPSPSPSPTPTPTTTPSPTPTPTSDPGPAPTPTTDPSPTSAPDRPTQEPGQAPDQGVTDRPVPGPPPEDRPSAGSDPLPDSLPGPADPPVLPGRAQDDGLLGLPSSWRAAR
jgi:hypothetical protein